MTQRYPGFEDEGGRRSMGSFQPQGGWRSHEGNEERWRASGRYEGGPHESHWGASCPTCGTTTAPSSSHGPARFEERAPNEGASFATPPPRGNWGSHPGNWGPSSGAAPFTTTNPEAGFYGQSPYQRPGPVGPGYGPETRGWSGNANRPSWSSPSIYGQPGGWDSENPGFSSAPSWSSPQAGRQDESSWRGGSIQGRGPKGYKRSDDRIREDISDRLMQGNVDAGDVTIAVKDGEVTLEGTVPDRSAKRRIEDLAESVLGASQVNNHLRIEASSDNMTRNRNLEGGSQRERDTESTSRDRSRQASGAQGTSRSNS